MPLSRKRLFCKCRRDFAYDVANVAAKQVATTASDKYVTAQSKLAEAVGAPVVVIRAAAGPSRRPR